MKSGYVHEAVLSMPGDHDARAVGAAVTQRLCGRWDHDGFCPVAPHHTSWSRDGETVQVRVLFAAEPVEEAGVRAMVEEVVRGGLLTGPDGSVATWTAHTSGPSALLLDERDRAARLADI